MDVSLSPFLGRGMVPLARLNLQADKLRFIAAVGGSARLRFVELPPETWKTNADDRERLVKHAIRDHYRTRQG